jgi:hypothetical protein
LGRGRRIEGRRAPANRRLGRHGAKAAHGKKLWQRAKREPRRTKRIEELPEKTRGHGQALTGERLCRIGKYKIASSGVDQRGHGTSSCLLAELRKPTVFNFRRLP